MKFNETFDLIITDKKTQTTRIPAERWWAWYKDVNERAKTAFAEGPGGNCQILLTCCFKTTLGTVRNDYTHYTREGFSSGEEFEAVWRKLYNEFNPDMEVCVIRFWKVPA